MGSDGIEWIRPRRDAEAQEDRKSLAFRSSVSVFLRECMLPTTSPWLIRILWIGLRCFTASPQPLCDHITVLLLQRGNQISSAQGHCRCMWHSKDQRALFSCLCIIWLVIYTVLYHILSSSHSFFLPASSVSTSVSFLLFGTHWVSITLGQGLYNRAWNLSRSYTPKENDTPSSSSY